MSGSVRGSQARPNGSASANGARGRGAGSASAPRAGSGVPTPGLSLPSDEFWAAKFKQEGKAHTAVREEEVSALFRNNLLRSVWQPGRSGDDVQRLLVAREARIATTMHLWMHPRLWQMYRFWKRRTLPLRRVQVLSARVQVRCAVAALKRLRSETRIRTMLPFLRAQHRQRHLHAW